MVMIVGKQEIVKSDIYVMKSIAIKDVEHVGNKIVTKYVNDIFLKSALNMINLHMFAIDARINVFAIKKSIFIRQNMLRLL